MTNRPTQPRSRRRGVTVQRPGGRSGPVERRQVCRCHPPEYYTNVKCPKCGHGSLDPGIGCERRACGYEEPWDYPDLGLIREVGEP
jgi:hypothetical protein